MARDSRPGSRTNASTGASPTATTTGTARTFFDCPSFHTLRVRRIMLLFVGVYAILQNRIAGEFQ